MMLLFYRVLNFLYRLVFGDRYMLHAPLFVSKDDSLFEAQRRFAEYCLRRLPQCNPMNILDAGCGNGMLTSQLADHFGAATIVGIDVDAAAIARAVRQFSSNPRLSFRVDDAQELRTIDSGSQHLVVCFESALHYRDKQRFLLQAARVLTSGGLLLLADIVRNDRGGVWFKDATGLVTWNVTRYQRSFEQANFEVLHEEDLTALITRAGAGSPYPVARRLFAPLVRLAWVGYRRLFRRAFRYQLWILQLRPRDRG